MIIVTYEDKFYGECKEDGLEGEDDAGEQCFVFTSRAQGMLRFWSMIMVIIKTTMTTTILRMIAIELISNHI